MSKIQNRGFTLIELLVVIAIIGILASVVLASLNSARTKSRDAVRKSDLGQLRTALEMYYADNGVYPTSDGWIEANTGGTLRAALEVGGYIKIPKDPSSTANTGGYNYMHYNNAATGKWTLWARLENPSAADTATLSTCALSNYDTNYSMNYCISN